MFPTSFPFYERHSAAPHCVRKLGRWVLVLLLGMAVIGSGLMVWRVSAREQQTAPRQTGFKSPPALISTVVVTPPPVQTFSIGGVTYSTCGASETVTAPFTSMTGEPTVNQYSGFVLLTVSGTGNSLGGTPNDAFYYDIPGNPTHDPNNYQLVTTVTNSVVVNDADDAFRHIVYDVDAGTAVTAPYTPVFRMDNTYTFVLDMSTLTAAPPGPAVLRFGVNDGSYGDNGGQYVVQITQLCSNTPPTITAQPGVARVPGGPAGVLQIATVDDAQDPKQTLAVTVNGGSSATVNGITISGINVNAAGQVTATIAAAANATPANFTLKVTDSQGAMATGTLTVNTLFFAVKIGDPAVCLDPGGIVGHEATLTNPNAGALAASFTATLPAGLTAVAGSCSVALTPNVGNPGTCTIAANGGSVQWNGTLAAGQTVTIVYRSRIPTNAGQGAQFCIDNMGTVGNVVAPLQFCFSLSCPNIVNARVSDQKAGSVLVFPYYTSTIGGGSDTRMTISNVSNAASTAANQAYVHLFFIDGTTCAQADLFLCLTPNASFSFKASDFDPGNTGYLLAVAVDRNGVPVQNNVLIGNAFVTTPQFADNYGAESFWANSFAVATVSGNTATLYFDQTGYDAVPKQFAVEIQSPLDAAGQQIVTAGLSGDLTTAQISGAAQVGTGQAFNEKEVFASFNGWLTGACQARATIATNSPRVPNGLGNLIKTGQSGSLKFNVGGAVGLLMTPRTATWKGIRTLHKTQTTVTTLTIPIFVPVC